MKKFFYVFLFSVFALALVLRVFNVWEVPPGVNRDEASIAYTAYSLLETGKDEYGRSFPVSFESFGDWKLPFYIYSVIPFVQLLGLTELSVRLPSIIFGFLTVVLVYFLVKEIFGNKTLALLSSFLIAVSPWHLHLSRVESESNTAVFFITLALLLFLKAVKGKNILLVPSFIFFALTYYIYAGNHVFTTLFFISLLLIYRKELFKNRFLIHSLLSFFLLAGFIFYQTFFGASATKLSGISIFGDPSVVHAEIEIPRNEHKNAFLGRNFHNRPLFALEEFSSNYLKSFSPEFLFISGGENKAHNIENFGNMYLVEAPFLLLGFFYLLRAKGKERVLIVLWLLIAPVAASITKDAPHTNRMFAIFPALPITVAFGLYYFLKTLENKKLRTLVLSLLTLLFLLNILVYLDRYYFHFPRNESENWGIGYKIISEKLNSEKYSEKNAVISNPTESPYIFLLFYSNYPPSKYQAEAQRYPYTEDKFLHVKSYANFEFRDINWDEDLGERVIVSEISEVPPEASEFEKEQIILPDGEVFRVLINTE